VVRKSVFHFDAQGSVGKSTHTELPWLRYIRRRLGDSGTASISGRLRAGISQPDDLLIAEVYPALWNRAFAKEDCKGDQHDAFCIATWLSRADRDATLPPFSSPACRLLSAL